mgnify:CR=1 FL=1
MRISPFVKFIKESVNVYIEGILYQPAFRKLPMYVMSSDKNFAYRSRNDISKDYYHYDAQEEQQHCIEQGLPSEVTTTESIEQFITYVNAKDPGVVIAEHQRCKDALRIDEKHELVLMTSDLTALEQIKQESNYTKEIFHYYSLIEFKTGVILHLLSTLDISNYEFVFHPGDATERQRISRKALSNGQTYSKLDSEESAIVCSAIINEILQ